MPNRSFTPGEKATAIALARLTTIDQTSVTLNIDKRTLRSWLATAPPPEESDAWRAAQQLAQQQLLTGLATGKVKHPPFLATIAGIAARNIRFGDMIARREQRRAAEQVPEPVAVPLRRREQWDAMHRAIGGHLWGDETAVSLYQRHAVRQLIDAIDALDQGDLGPDVDWSSVGWLAVQREALDAPIDGQPRDRAELPWHYLPDAEYADDERYQRELDAIAIELRAAADEWMPKHLAELATHKVYRNGRIYTVLAADGTRVLSGTTYLPAEYADHPVEDSQPMSGQVLDAPTDKEAWMVNVTPEPAIPAVPRPPSGPVTVLEVGEHLEDHPTWRRWND